MRPNPTSSTKHKRSIDQVLLTSAPGLSSWSKVVLSYVALAGGCFILRYVPSPHGLGRKNALAFVWANVRKLILDLAVAMASAQSISRTSSNNGRFCGTGEEARQPFARLLRTLTSSSLPGLSCTRFIPNLPGSVQYIVLLSYTV